MATQATNLEIDAQQTFPFMKLPAELRLVIYELTVDDMIEYTEYSNQSSSMVGSQMRARGMLALLLTSKTIRAESSKALMPLWTTYLNGLEKAVKDLEHDRRSRSNLCIFNSMSQAKEVYNALPQLSHQLVHMNGGRLAKVAVHLALQRAADSA